MPKRKDHLEHEPNGEVEQWRWKIHNLLAGDKDNAYALPELEALILIATIEERHPPIPYLALRDSRVREDVGQAQPAFHAAIEQLVECGAVEEMSHEGSAFYRHKASSYYLIVGTPGDRTGAALARKR
jgi:hypothetical protein